MKLEYMELVEYLEWMPNVWQRCNAIMLAPTPLGYVYHTAHACFVLYHLHSGVNLGIVATTEEAARTCLEGLVEYVLDWWSVDGSPRVFSPLVAPVVAYLQAQGYPLQQVALGSVYE